MRIAVVLALLAFGCGSKKDAPPTEASGSATKPEPPKGSDAPKGSDVAKGSDAPKGSDAGSGSATAQGSGSDAGSAAGSGSGSDAGWEFAKLDHQAQMDFMKKTVVPTMKPLFQKFDGKKYKEFGCKTCHGKDPKASKFKMPTGDLPKLDFAALEAGKQEPKIAKWMAETIKPEMAKLLKLPEMTQTNHTGFGCLGCHEQKK